MDDVDFEMNPEVSCTCGSDAGSETGCRRCAYCNEPICQSCSSFYAYLCEWCAEEAHAPESLTPE